MRKIAVIIGGILLLGACNQKKVERLEGQVDSLRTVINVNGQQIDQLTQEIDNIDNLLDSIEATEKIVQLNLDEGNSGKTTVDRIKNLKGYLDIAKGKVEELEAKMKKKNRAHAYLLSRMKKQLKEKEAVIEGLKEDFKKLHEQNEMLTSQVNKQSEELSALDSELKAKQEEYNNLKELSQMTKAKLLYDAAGVTEELARKTFFAPKKKRARFKSAYELYQQALELGYAPAQEKIDELSKKVK